MSKVIRVSFGFPLLPLVIGLKKARATFSTNQAWNQNQSWIARAIFPALRDSYVHLRQALIGSLDCLCILWLARVITLVFVLGNAAKNSYNINLSWKTQFLPITLYSACYSLPGSGKRGSVNMRKVSLHPLPPPQWSSCPRTKFAFPQVNGSSLFKKKCMESSIAWGVLLWRVTLLPGTTLLHLNRP